MLKRAQEVIATSDERQVVDYAVEVYRLLSQASKELEIAKGYLRQVALGRNQSKALSSVELEGNFGTATVAFPKLEVRARKSPGLSHLEPVLSKGLFADLFVKEIVIRPVPDFVSRFGQLAAGEKAFLAQFLEILPPTPKVFLTK